MAQGAFEQALPLLQQALAAEPDSALLAHRLGRSLLALERASEALPHLRRATQLSAQTAEYHFWLGVAWWALLDFDRERDSYLAALRLDPDHLPARLYLAHNALDRDEWETALMHYRIVLSREPAVPEACHNVAMALERLGRPAEARAAWEAYFAIDATSPLALAAVERLNAVGVFSHRAFVIGARQMVLPAVRFLPGTSQLADPQSRAAIDRIGQAMTETPSLALHIVVHAPRAALARERALAIQRRLSAPPSAISAARLHLSWFSTPENVMLGPRRLQRLRETVRFITAMPTPPRDALPGATFRLRLGKHRCQGRAATPLRPMGGVAPRCGPSRAQAVQAIGPARHSPRREARR
jgi:tetratricopeptide (TPR) repeat protein